MSGNTKVASPSRVPLRHKRIILIMLGLVTGSMAPTFYSLARANVQPAILAEFNGMQYYAIVSITAVLTMAVCSPISGRLGDMYGRKKLFVGSTLVYLASLIGCAASPNILIYTVCIAVSGGTQGFISALINAIIADVAAPEDRPKYVGYNSTASTVVMLLGPLLSGFIADTFSWRVLFLIGIPLLVVSSIMLIKYLPNDQLEKAAKKKIDIGGAFAFLGAIVPVLVLLSLGGTIIPWKSVTTLVILVLSVAFTLILVRIDTRHPAPMISFYTFKNRSFLKLFLACLCLSIGTSMHVYLPYYFQNVMGISTALSGTLITPRSIATVVATAAVGAIMAKTGKYKEPLVVMLVLTVASFAAMGFLFTATTGIPLIIVLTVINGLGNTAMIVAVMTISMQIMEPKDIGVGVSLLTFVSALAGSVGNAVGGLLTNNAWGTVSVPADLQAALDAQQLSMLSNVSILKDAQVLESIRSGLSAEMATVFDSTILSFRQTLGQGIDQLFLVMGGVSLVALVLILALKLPNQPQSPKR